MSHNEDCAGGSKDAFDSKSIPEKFIVAGYGPDMADSVGLPAPKLDGPLGQLTKADYESGWARRYGTSNPQVLHVPFYDAMISENSSPFNAVRVLRAVLDDYIPWSVPGKKVWTMADRSGQTRTDMPDHRQILIGGHYENTYDPARVMYNDVLVIYPGMHGTSKLHGYPKRVFHPTCNHSATRMGKYIYIIGGLAQKYDRAGETRFFCLNTDFCTMEKVKTTGDAPGWIHSHSAIAVSTQEIVVEGGKVIDPITLSENDLKGHYVLNVHSGMWMKLKMGTDT